MNDLADVFVGTGKGVRGNKAFSTKARFKGVRVEKGEERFLCRPIVGSQKGRCPSFPPESCLKVKPQKTPDLHYSLDFHSPTAPPDAPPSHSSLMCQTNREVTVRAKKAVNSLNLAKTKAAEQLRERYFFSIIWRVRSPCKIWPHLLCLCLVVPTFKLRLLKECSTNVNKKWLQ
jgi:hypothetical protein